MNIDPTGVLIACVGGAGMLVALAVGFHVGVKTAGRAIRQMGRDSLEDADYDEFLRLLRKVYKGESL